MAFTAGCRSAGVRVGTGVCGGARLTAMPASFPGELDAEVGP